MAQDSFERRRRVVNLSVVPILILILPPPLFNPMILAKTRVTIYLLGATGCDGDANLCEIDATACERDAKSCATSQNPATADANCLPVDCKPEPRNLMMSPDEYLKQITPPMRRSELDPLSADLRYLRDKGCSIRQLTEYASAQGVAVHLSTVARFMAALAAPANEVAPALPAPGPSAALSGAEVSPPRSPKPYVFQQTEGEIARAVMVRLRAKDSGKVESARPA